MAHPYINEYPRSLRAPSEAMLRKTMGQLRKRSLVTSHTETVPSIRVGARPEIFTLDPARILTDSEIAAYLVIINSKCTTIPTTVGESRRHITEALKLKEHDRPSFQANVRTAAKLGYVTFSNLDDDSSDLQLTAKTYSELPYLLLLFMNATALKRS